MQLALFLFVVVGLVVAAASRKISPGEQKGVHHSTKKELKDPNRFPRKTQQQTQGQESKGSGTDVDPALVYALPPVGLLHQGRGFGYGLGGAGAVGGVGAGYDAASLAALIGSSGFQEGKQDLLAYDKQPVYHTAPLEQYNALLANHVAAPVEEPRQEEVQGGGAHHTVQAVQEAAHSFVNSPKYYSHDQHEDEYKDYAAKYQFGYRVRDLHTGNDFGQTESRDGHLTQGHYHVLLPDGRLQNVQYWSDHSGFHAKVSYDGFSHHH